MTMMNPYNYQRPKNFIKPAPIQAGKPSKSVNRIPTKSNSNGKLDKYLESKVMSAKPEELTYMLYDGLVKFIKKAKLHLENKNYEDVNYNAKRAQAIIDELRNTLNMEIEMSAGMDALYEYMAHKLLTGNIDKSVENFDDALKIAEEFRDTWKQAFNIQE